MSIDLHITKRPSPNHNNRGGRAIDTIVLHDTASRSLETTVSWLQDSESAVSYHYIVDRTGAIVQLVEDSERAWHAGVAHLHGTKTDVNGRSVGVALISDGQSGYPDAQVEACAKLVRQLMQRYGVRWHNVVGHRDIAVPPGRKLDPGDYFDWEAFRRLVLVQPMASPGES